MLKIESKDQRGLDVITGQPVSLAGVLGTPGVISVREGPYKHFNGQIRTSFIPGRYSNNAVYLASAKSLCTSGQIYYPPLSKVYSGYLFRGKLALQNVNVSGAAQISGFAARTVPVWNSRMADLAFVNAYAKMNEPDVFDSGTFLGELSDTIRMFHSPFRGIHDFIFKDRRWRDPRRLVEASASTWMEFRYGIKPLAYDIAKIAALFHASNVKKALHMESKRSKVQQSGTWAGDTSMGMGNILGKWHDRGEWTDEYNAGVTYVRNPGITGAVYHRLGVSVRDLPNLFWELTPLSFVVDWMYNVGPWLQAIVPNPYVQLLGGFVSRKYSETISRTSIGSTYTGRTNSYLNQSKLNVEISTLERVARLNLPAMPVRRVDLLNLKRSIDSVSLLWQRLPRRWRAAN